MRAKSLFTFFDQPVLNKTLFIVRGVPGTGISSIAELIANEMYSADDLFYTIGDGQYEYDPKMISEAHEQCFKNVLSAMRRGVNRIAVHNTFAKKKDYWKYIKAARAAGYTPFILTCESSNIGSTRNIPKEKIKNIWNKFERHDLEESKEREE